MPLNSQAGAAGVDS